MASFFSGLFGGGNEIEAANRNRGETTRYQNSGLGTLDQALGRSTGTIQDYGQNARNLYGDTRSQYSGMRDRGMGYLDSARDSSLASLNQGRSNYDSLDALGKKYGGATSLYLDSLGVNGAGGNQNAVNAFQTGPGYGFATDQATQAIERARAKRGMYNSGNLDLDTNTAIQGLANQEYGNWQDRLGSNRQYELGATQAAATGRSGFDRDIASLYQADAGNRIGLENSAASGIAGANSGQAGSEQWMGNSLANLYTGDATNRLGVYGNVSSSNQTANNLEAQGRSQGQRNALGTYLSLMNNIASVAGGGGGGGGGGSFGGLFSTSNQQTLNNIGSGSGNQTGRYSNTGYG
jgi:hypothetical protein